MVKAKPIKVKVTSSKEYEQIKKDLKQYLQHIVNKEFEESMDYMPSEFFDIFPRSQMLLVMENALNIPDVEMNFKNPRIESIEKSVKIKRKYYSFITYSTVTSIKMLDDFSDETLDEKTFRINLIKLSLEKGFGSNNVAYKSRTDSFEIKTSKNAYAISKNGKSNWKFLVLEEEQKIVLEKILPKDLHSKI
ncbi:hypothetical protein NBT05_07850 [Aquimarina sp. ERC-38]|uniref:hypothetical protein n=1 Tax=Aquimarina sp. ERC-38 TaxID=2949996 RepID=UPI0022473C21|nr:hypothetical protein [Aquimarina sp. ERC-38]UZO82377.1 hypothetical protein NBT05_07850 [Aquimarina sp. ERC-38]